VHQNASFQYKNFNWGGGHPLPRPHRFRASGAASTPSASRLRAPPLIFSSNDAPGMRSIIYRILSLSVILITPKPDFKGVPMFDVECNAETIHYTGLVTMEY